MSLEHVAAVATVQPADFISHLSIKYGSRDLLARYFLLADRRLRERGVVLTFGTFRELLDINVVNRSNWLPLTPTFNCSYNELAGDTSFCLIGRDTSGVAVASHAGRLFDWRSGSFAEAAESLRLFYDKPERDALTGETCKVTSVTAPYLGGMVSYTGAVWYRPDYRGLGLPFYVSRIARAYAYAQWSVDYAVGMVSDANVSKGLTDKTGNSHIERGVHSRGSTHGDVDYHIVWSTPREIFAQLTAVLAGDEGRGSMIDQRRA